MNAIGRIFGRGRQVENLLKKAEESYGAGDMTECIKFSTELRAKMDPKTYQKHLKDVARSFYLEASSHFKLGATSHALDTIKEALELPGELGDIARLLGEIALMSGDERIIEVLELANEKIPDNNHITLALCNKYVAIERFDESAYRIFSRMHQRSPENQNVIFGLAMCLHKLEKYDAKSLQVYRRAFHEFSTNNDILFALAKSYASMDNPVAEALPVIERAIKFYNDEEDFLRARIAILSNLSSLTADQVRLLVAEYKKTRDIVLAEKLVGHLLASHSDDEDSCRVYEAVWEGHDKQTTMLSILSERYRLAGRKDNQAIQIYQAFFDDMPRDGENTVFLSKLYAAKKNIDPSAVLVYQQTLRDGAKGDVDNVVKVLAQAYLSKKRHDEEAARIYRMAHNIEPENYEILKALRDVAIAGGKMDGARATPLIEYILHRDTNKGDADDLAEKLGESLAKEGRTDEEACKIYKLNVVNRDSSPEQEELLVKALITRDELKLTDIALVERVYSRGEDPDIGVALSDLYRQAGSLDNKNIKIVIRALQTRPDNSNLASWALPKILEGFASDPKYSALIADLVIRGHLSGIKKLNPGMLSSAVSSIARQFIENGEFDRSIKLLSEAFKYEADPVLQYLLGVSYQGSGDFATGIGVFKSLLKNDKGNPMYRYRMVVLSLLNGDIDSAEKEINQLKAQFPDHPLVSLRHGMILESKNKLVEAAERYKSIKSREKEIIAFRDYRLGILDCATGSWESGSKLLERATAAGIKSKALELAKNIARITIVDQNLSPDGNLDSAEQKLKSMLDIVTNPWTVVTSERFLRLALLRLKAADIAGAQRALQSALKLRPNDGRVSSVTSLLDFLASRPKAAMERLESALSTRDPLGAELANRLWCVLSIRLGRFDEARNSADWLVAIKADDAIRMRFLVMYRNPLEVDWPPALNEWKYDRIEKDFGFPVGLIGRMAYKRADYQGGAEYLEKYFKNEEKTDRVEAEFLLGLMYIKLKKANLGLHYWSNILTEGHKQLTGKQRTDNLMLLGYHFLEHGEIEKSREAFKLAKESGAQEKDIISANALSHLQAGYIQAKSDNMPSAIREWEKIIEDNVHRWKALQNLGLAHFWKNNDDKALEYFNELFLICENSPEEIESETFSFVQEETRKMINQLVALRGVKAGEVRGTVKREMLLDEIQEANRHYWTLGIKKGATSQVAQANYFRLIKIYNPEKYPQDFMILEKAYNFFNKPGLLKKNEQRVFNAFNFAELGLETTGGLADIPASPQLVDFIKGELDPKKQLDVDRILEDSASRKDPLPAINTSADFNVPDYLIQW
ncbi:MAG TPA: hypothetical protein VGB30_09660 [bacterium]|jgi:tetratricopeptide (TPR) repeat protein